jgi:hypothetical protein
MRAGWLARVPANADVWSWKFVFSSRHTAVLCKNEKRPGALAGRVHLRGRRLTAIAELLYPGSNAPKGHFP